MRPDGAFGLVTWLHRATAAFAAGMVGAGWTTCAILVLRFGRIGWAVLFAILWFLPAAAGIAAYLFVIAHRPRVLRPFHGRALVVSFGLGIASAIAVAVVATILHATVPAWFEGMGLLAMLLSLALLLSGLIGQCGHVVLERTGWIRIAGDDRTCESCGYDLRGSPTGTCPECGGRGA